jgi:hypothetical protein
MQSLFRLFVFMFFLLFSSSSLAESAIGCGMVASADGQVVEALNGTICEDDLAYQVQTILYTRIFHDPFWRPLVELFVEPEVLDNDFNIFAADTLDISTPIYAILSGIATLATIVFVPLLSFKVWQIGLLIKKTGEVKLTEEKGDSVKFSLYFFMLIFLMVPTGGILMGQGLAVVGSLPAIKGANYILSSYLNNLSLGSTDVALTRDDVLLESQMFSSEVIAIELCEQRTRKLITAVNAKQGTSFVKDTAGLDLLGLSTDQEDIHERVDACLSYVGITKPLPEGDGIKNIAFNKKHRNDYQCPKYGVYAYEDESYGYDHSCGNISYTYPTNYDEMEDWGISDELTSIQSKFGTKNYYPRFKQKRTEIESVINNKALPIEERISALTEIYKSWAISVLVPDLRAHALLNDPKKEVMSTKYVYALNSLMGGSTTRSDWADTLREWSFLYEDERYWGIDRDEMEGKLGIDLMMHDAHKAAKDLQAYHCASNWEDYSELRVFIATYNLAEEEDTSELLTSNIQAMECLEFIPEKERRDGPFSKYVRYAVDNPLSYEDIQVEAGLVTLVPLDDVRKKDIIARMQGDISSDYYDSVLLQKAMLEGYIYAVKIGVSMAMQGELIDVVSANEIMPVARAKGFSAFGSMLMAISQEEGGGSHFKTMLSSSVAAVSEGEDEFYFNIGAFGDSDTSLEKKETALKSFSKVTTGNIFRVGDASVAPKLGGDYFNKTLQADEDLNQFTGWLENKLFSPMSHIKKASGIPNTMSLNDGLQNCLEGVSENCVSSASHPMVSLMRFGHDLMNNMLTLAILDILVSKLDASLSSSEEGSVGDDDDAKKKKKSKLDALKKSVKSFGKKVAKIVGGPILFVILAIIKVVAMILEVMRPFIWGLFSVGVFFAYVVPMMSFILSMTVYLLWVGSIFVISVTLPFYCLLKLKDVEYSYKNGFNEFYETFLGPYFKPLFIIISLIFAWTFVWISLFVTNTLFALVFEGITPGSGFSLQGLIMKLLVYVVYFMVLFVMFKATLDMIKSMPDMFASVLKLKGSKDEQYIQSLGFEQFVQTSMMKQIAQAPFLGFKNMVQANRRDAELKSNMSKMNAFMAAYEGDKGGMADAARSAQSPSQGSSDMDAARAEAEAMNAGMSNATPENNQSGPAQSPPQGDQGESSSEGYDNSPRPHDDNENRPSDGDEQSYENPEHDPTGHLTSEPEQRETHIANDAPLETTEPKTTVNHESVQVNTPASSSPNDTTASDSGSDNGSEEDSLGSDNKPKR